MSPSHLWPAWWKNKNKIKLHPPQLMQHHGFLQLTRTNNIFTKKGDTQIEKINFKIRPPTALRRIQSIFCCCFFTHWDAAAESILEPIIYLKSGKNFHLIAGGVKVSHIAPLLHRVNLEKYPRKLRVFQDLPAAVSYSHCYGGLTCFCIFPLVFCLCIVCKLCRLHCL